LKGCRCAPSSSHLRASRAWKGCVLFATLQVSPWLLCVVGDAFIDPIQQWVSNVRRWAGSLSYDRYYKSHLLPFVPYSLCRSVVFSQTERPCLRNRSYVFWLPNTVNAQVMPGSLHGKFGHKDVVLVTTVITLGVPCLRRSFFVLFCL